VQAIQHPLLVLLQHKVWPWFCCKPNQWTTTLVTTGDVVGASARRFAGVTKSSKTSQLWPAVAAHVPAQPTKTQPTGWLQNPLLICTHFTHQPSQEALLPWLLLLLLLDKHCHSKRSCCCSAEALLPWLLLLLLLLLLDQHCCSKCCCSCCPCNLLLSLT
jgi:hypothetical protein